MLVSRLIFFLNFVMFEVSESFFINLEFVVHFLIIKILFLKSNYAFVSMCSFS